VSSESVHCSPLALELELTLSFSYSASSNLIIDSEFITLDGSGLALKSYRDKNTDSGNVAVRWFCSECGSPIRTVVEGKEETSYLKTGKLYFWPSSKHR
jgi:hypothetical protein